MSFKIFYKKLGKRIKYLREEKDLTQEQLAEKVGLSLDFIGKIEVAISKPSVDTLIKIIKALNVEPFEIFKFD
ncbi:MAG: helix-turn-helix transcriptional regulator [Candidatus Gastranaerophilaceae bacterium]|jgi:transcriptional regulator with XRE-family HTH domain